MSNCPYCNVWIEEETFHINPDDDYHETECDHCEKTLYFRQWVEREIITKEEMEDEV